MADDGAGFLSRWSKRKAQTRVGIAPAEPAPPPPPVVAPMPTPAPSLRPQPGSDRPPGGPDEAAPPEHAPLPTTDEAPLPTMDDVALLTHASDYSRFVAPGVDAGVSNAAMKKLFTDPHFNVMDRLDIYIDDYGLPDPIPESMLRQMVQSKFLGLFDHEEKDEAAEQAAKAQKGATAERAAVADVDPNAAATADANAGANAGANTTADAGANTAAEPAAPAMNQPGDLDENTDLQLQPNDAAGHAGADQGARPRPV